LRDYTKERLLIGDVDVSFKHLYLVYKIMKNLGFTHVDIDRRYSVKDVVERLEIPSITNAFARGTLFDSLLKTINFTEFALAQNYDSLIDTAMSKNRIMQLDARLSAEKGLQWAVKHFNKGNFEAFASSIINKNMQWFNKNKVLSLDSKIINGDEDFTLKEVLRAESTIPILDILDTLNDKERIIVEGYLGLDGEKRTFAELASEINMTSMEIRKVYDAALKKLRNGLDNSIASLFS